MQKLKIRTSGEDFYSITEEVQRSIEEASNGKSGVVTLFTTHTSCALTISESYDPSAKDDLVNFMKKLAPRNQNWFTHTMEGEDDSPSHMKSILLATSLNLIVESGKAVLGTWQGIYLAEFRDAPKNREILLQFIEQG